MIKGNLGLLCVSFYSTCFITRVIFLWMKRMSFEKLKQVFSAVLLTCAVFFLIASVLLSSCYLLELNGPITPCSATFDFVLVH